MLNFVVLNKRIIIYALALILAPTLKAKSSNETIVSVTNSIPSKIVGLIQVRNDESFIEQCLRALSCYADEIVILDDASEDNTLAVIKSLQKELNITKIIELADSSWLNRSERYNRQLLLDAGRQIGGTHFILIDADEMFTAVCLKNNWLRKKILAMKKGQMLGFRMMNVWGSADYYRNDRLCNPKNDIWAQINCIFCDDGITNYAKNNHYSASGAIHISRELENRICTDGPKTVLIKDINYGLIHFKSVNLTNITTKKIWYMCLEYIRATESNAISDKKSISTKVNHRYEKIGFYGMEEHETKIALKKVPDNWYKDYTFFDREKISAYNWARHNDILKWMAKYGLNFFSDLHIWNVSWLEELKK